MKDFLDVAEDIKTYSAEVLLPQELEYFKNIFDALEMLQAVHYKATFDPRNIEDIFGAFEMSRLIGKLGNFPDTKIQTLRKSIKIVIQRTLEERIQYPSNPDRVFPPEPYKNFCLLLHTILKNNQASIITFNYDLALDFALFFSNLFVKYSISTDQQGNPDITRTPINLFKLHGSLNWANCPKCGVIPWHLESFFNIPGGSRWPNFPSGGMQKLKLTDQLPAYHQCPSYREPDPTIIPPTWNKTEHSNILAEVWRGAAQELFDADNIIVMGYSLPTNDLFFKYLFAIGTLGPRRIRLFRVYDPDDTGGVRERFVNLLGPSTIDRFEYISKTFEWAIRDLSDTGILTRNQK